MQKKTQAITATLLTDHNEDVVLNLTLSGAKGTILTLLEQLDALSGFSVVKGSFIVANNRNTPL